LIAVVRASPKSKADVPTYSVILNLEELLSWVNTTENQLDYEEIPPDKKDKFAMTRLKGNASLWWDGVQSKRKNNNKQPIKSWAEMVVKLKGKFLPKDYQLSLYRKMQN